MIGRARWWILAAAIVIGIAVGWLVCLSLSAPR